MSNDKLNVPCMLFTYFKFYLSFNCFVLYTFDVCSQPWKKCTCQQYKNTCIYFQKLYLPPGFSVTSPEKRNWIINPMGMHQPMLWYLPFPALIAALMVFILLFMEFQITS